MSEITFLGTSGAVASKERDNTSLLIKTEKDSILIDLPGSPVKKLAKLNIDFRGISTIFFTHSHPDHIYGIVSLLHSQYKLKNQLDIYAHPNVIKLIRILRESFKLDDTHKYPGIIYHKILPWQKRIFYDSNQICVWAFKTKHSRDSIGFRFYFKKINKTVVYSVDTAFNPHLQDEAFGCDWLIHDCFAPERLFKRYPEAYRMHTSSLLLGKLATYCQVKILAPIHFATEVKYSIQEIIKEIKESFTGKVVIPSDLQTLKLN